MESKITPFGIVGCIVVTFVVAGLAVLALKIIATPPGYEDRLAVAEQKIARAERLTTAPGDGAAFPKGAVCEGLNEAALEKIRQDVEQAGVTEGLMGLQVAWSAPKDSGGRIAPVPLNVRAEGSYEKIASFMDRLGGGSPTLFVDTADLTAGGAGVQLSLSGKVFCWTRG